MYRLLIQFLVIICLLVACQSKKKQAEAIELTKPEWLKNRPTSTNYFYGIGVSSKEGGSLYYSEKAKERALADLAKQINSRISSETHFIKSENSNGVSEYIQSRIKASSSEYLEGYEMVDQWEDMTNLFVFYRLSKQEFYRLKADRKQKAINHAFLKYNQAKLMEQQNIVKALSLYASSIDALSGYLNEETSTEIDGSPVDVFELSKEGISSLLKSLSLKCPIHQIEVSKGSPTMANTYPLTISSNKGSCEIIPVKFSYSGGYISNDILSANTHGQLFLPSVKYNNKEYERLTAEISHLHIARLITKNLFVRQLVENFNAPKTTIEISFK